MVLVSSGVGRISELDDEDRDGGGTEGYERFATAPGYGTGGLDVRDAEEGGVVSVVVALV